MFPCAQHLLLHTALEGDLRRLPESRLLGGLLIPHGVSELERLQLLPLLPPQLWVDGDVVANVGPGAGAAAELIIII